MIYLINGDDTYYIEYYVNEIKKQVKKVAPVKKEVKEVKKKTPEAKETKENNSKWLFSFCLHPLPFLIK